MKIGIISINMYSKGLNFACPLHTYAFQQFLLNNGIESTVINYTPVYYDDFDLRHPADYFLKKYNMVAAKPVSSDGEIHAKEEKLEELHKKYVEYQAIYKEREVRYDKFQDFIDKNYIKTDIRYDSDLLEVMDPGFDCYICVTDVIWKNETNVGFDRGFFLAGKAMENKWKIAYAASRGARIADTEEDKKLFFHYLDDIDRISVREASLRNYIEQNSDKKAVEVLDPVLLHGKEFYEKIVKKPEDEHYIFLYYVMEKASDTIRQAVQYARKYKLKIIEVTERSSKEGRLGKYTDIKKEYRYDVGLEEWLGYIRYADCVFTNSFHACCFSILFEREFFAGYRHGDKVTNILEVMGLQNRRINLESDLISTPPEPIDYSGVRERLAQKREESAAFILSAIHEIEGKKRPEHDYESFRRSLVYKVFYNSRSTEETLSYKYKKIFGKVIRAADHSLEFHPKGIKAVNNGTSVLMKNGFVLPGYRFAGWNIRLRIDNRYFWYLENGSLALKETYSEEKDPPIKLFAENDKIPYISVNHISVMVAEAVWEKEETDYLNIKDAEREDKWKEGLWTRAKKLLKKI